MHGMLGLQHLERLRPELQTQDVALPREQVVVHVHPRHRAQVAADDAVGDERGDLGILVAAVLDVVQRVGPNLQPLLVLVVPLGHASVKIPAVIVETRGIGDLANLIRRLAGEMSESDDDVSHLDTGVVDIVLHFDGNTAEAQDADQRVAERRVPQVADVCRLVGIDRRVLDDGLAAGVRPRRCSRGQPFAQERRSLEEEVQITVRCRGDALDAFERSEVTGDLLRNRPRRLAQPPRQLERHRRAEVAEVAIGRVLEGERAAVPTGSSA